MTRLPVECVDACNRCRAEQKLAGARTVWHLDEDDFRAGQPDIFEGMSAVFDPASPFKKMEYDRLPDISID